MLHQNMLSGLQANKLEEEAKQLNNNYAKKGQEMLDH
jgi:hypothetical protein